MKTLRQGASAALLAALLAACGGGGGDGGTSAPASCSVADQKSWLGGYMGDWYFWYALSPRPDASATSTIAAYFDALLYTGTSATFPSDRWSNVQSTESFNRFFGDGATLGYGVSVSGVEANGDSTRPLWVRYVDPGSPAAAAGVARGDQVISLNGRTAADAIAAQDYSALGASLAGDRLTLVLRRAGVDRTVPLTAAVYNLAPVPLATQVTSTGGRKLGVLQVNQMISQAAAPLDTAFAQFRSQGVQDLVLDLRYNGGGLVSLGATLASYITGSRAVGQRYASLIYNDKHQASNSTYDFTQPGNALSLQRVFVLQGPRTCSASEQVINGLVGAGVQVIAIGSTSCGKPVGFNPTSNCGSTYSVVNFESVNRQGTGRYFDGLAPTCSVAEDFSAAQNGSTDPLLSAAGLYADSGACPRSAPTALRGQRQRLLRDGGEPAGMLAR
jgi:carboxyl-terminal processing protease